MRDPDDHPAEVRNRRHCPSIRRWLRVLAVLTLLPTFAAGLAPFWWIGDLFCHFRVQYVFALLPVTALAASLRCWKLTVVLIAALATNVGLISPLLMRRTSDHNGGTSGSVRLLSANVYVGNSDAIPVIELVRREQPDLLLAMEVDPPWLEKLADLGDEFPFRISALREQGFAGSDPFGMALFSRRPAASYEVHRVGTERLPVIVADFAPDGSSLRVICAHPYPPVRRDCAAIRDEYLAALAPFVAAAEGPCVLMGDLNTTSWSPVFSGLIRQSGLRDSRSGFGIQPTWPDGNWLLQIPIDHVLVSPEISVIDRRVGPSIGSDHRPLIVELGIRGRTSGP